MESNFFLKGCLLGFIIAAAIGPIAILCIRKTFQFGRWSGLLSGLGAAFADAIYGFIAAFGLTLISDFLLASQIWLRIMGAAFLIYLGAKTYFSKPVDRSAGVTHITLINDFVTTFFLTLINPSTVLSFLAFFAGLGLAETDNYKDAVWLVCGVFIGSSVWWIILCEGVAIFRQKMNQKVMIWINRSAGLFIAGFGLAMLAVL